MFCEKSFLNILGDVFWIFLGPHKSLRLLEYIFLLQYWPKLNKSPEKYRKNNSQKNSRDLGDNGTSCDYLWFYFNNPILTEPCNWCDCCCCCCDYPSFSSGLEVRHERQFNAVILIEISLSERWQPISNQSWMTGSPTTKADCHWRIPKSRLLWHAGWATSQL